MSRSRLAKLSHAQLVELAAEACESSPELKNKADALIAKVARSTSRSRVSRSRLAKFSHAQLREIAAAGASWELRRVLGGVLAVGPAPRNQPPERLQQDCRG